MYLTTFCHFTVKAAALDACIDELVTLLILRGIKVCFSESFLEEEKWYFYDWEFKDYNYKFQD